MTAARRYHPPSPIQAAQSHMDDPFTFLFLHRCADCRALLAGMQNESPTWLSGISAQFNSVLVLDDYGLEFGVREPGAIAILMAAVCCAMPHILPLSLCLAPQCLPTSHIIAVLLDSLGFSTACTILGQSSTTATTFFLALLYKICLHASTRSSTTNAACSLRIHPMGATTCPGSYSPTQMGR